MRSQICHQNNYNLVFQLIVSDYLTICKHFKNCHEVPSHHHRELIDQMFTSLLGPQIGQLNVISLHLDCGILFNLQRSCQHLQLCEAVDSQSAQKLSHYVQKILRLCQQSWKMIEKSDPFHYATLIFLKLFISKIQNALHKMGQLITKLFFKMRDDETILLFLLQNHQALDYVFHSQFVCKLFSKMFEEGVSAAESYIIKQYNKRHYRQLLPLIATFSKELQSKMP